MRHLLTTSADYLVDGLPDVAASIVADFWTACGCPPSSFTLHIGAGVFREHPDVAARLVAIRTLAGFPVQPVEEPPSPGLQTATRGRLVELRPVP